MFLTADSDSGKDIILTDNIFIDISRFLSFNVTAVFNSLSHQNGQLLTLHDLAPRCKSIRIINDDSLEDFKHKLHQMNWSRVNRVDEVNDKCNIFINEFSGISEKVFPNMFVRSNNGTVRTQNKTWIIKGIKQSCKTKRNFIFQLECLRTNKNWSLQKVLKVTQEGNTKIKSNVL